MKNLTQCEDVSGLPFVEELDDLLSTYSQNESEMLRSVSLYAQKCVANQSSKPVMQAKINDFKNTHRNLYEKMSRAQKNLEPIETGKCANAIKEAMKKLSTHGNKTAGVVSKACPSPFNLEYASFQ